MTFSLRLLVTGGSGYLGSHLVRLAAREDRWDTWALYFQHAPPEPNSARWEHLDLRDASAVGAIMRAVRPQVVIHTAYGGSSDHGEDGPTVSGSYHIARAAEEVGARLIHLSTDAIFDGERPPYAETDPPFPVTSYGRAKAAAEWHVLTSGPAAQVIVRTSLIIGLAPMAPHLRWIVESVQKQKPIVLYTDEYRCPTWGSDLAAALLELAEIDYRGILHVASPQRVSRYELGERVLRWLGMDPVGVTAAEVDRRVIQRPRDVTLDVSRAGELLQTPLRTLDDGLAHHERIDI